MMRLMKKRRRRRRRIVWTWIDWCVFVVFIFFLSCVCVYFGGIIRFLLCVIVCCCVWNATAVYVVRREAATSMAYIFFLYIYAT